MSKKERKNEWKKNLVFDRSKSVSKQASKQASKQVNK